MQLLIYDSLKQYNKQDEKNYGFVVGILKQEECNVLYEIWQIYVACQTNSSIGEDKHGSSKPNQKSNEIRKNSLK